MSKSFTFFQSFADAANMMEDIDRLAFYDAMVNCAIYGEDVNNLPPAADLVFTAIRPILEANVRDRDNGKTGGRPKKENPSENPNKNPTKNPSTKPKVKYSKVNVEYSRVEDSKVKESSKESGQAATATRFIPPTLEEIKAFIAEKGYNVNALKFYSYYSSNGWKVGKNPMKSWKQAIVSWNCDAQEQPVRKVDNIHNIGDFSNERSTL